MTPAARIQKLWSALLTPLSPWVEVSLQTTTAAMFGALAGAVVFGIVGALLHHALPFAITGAIVGAILAALNRHVVLACVQWVGGLLDILFFALRIP